MRASPVLEGEVIRLCPFSDRHLTDTYVSWLNDQDLMLYSEQRHVSHSIATCRDYVAQFKSGPSILWAIEDLNNQNRHVGNIVATIDEKNRLADISLLIGHPGCGFGKLSWQMVMEYLEHRSDIRKITGGCVRDNRAMIRIMSKNGMQPDGFRARQFLVSGSAVDVMYFAKFSGRGSIDV